MTVVPSCPVLLIHEDDTFRKSLIATLDQQHFSVTFCADQDAAALLRSRPGSFKVVLLHVDLGRNVGTSALDYLEDHRQSCGVILLGEPDPRLRIQAPWADETLLMPVDADYVATRARNYCNC